VEDEDEEKAKDDENNGGEVSYKNQEGLIEPAFTFEQLLQQMYWNLNK
jgi:hypothetical protein